MGTWLASPKGACTKAEPKPQQTGETCPHHVSVCLVALQRPSGFAKREVRLSQRASRLSKIPPVPRREGRWRISRCFQSALQQGGRPTPGGTCKAHPGSAARPLHCTTDGAPGTRQTPFPRSGVGGSARSTPGSKFPLRGTPGTRMAATSRHSQQQMGHGQGRERRMAGRERQLARCPGLPPRCLRREREVAPFPAQQPAASSHFPLC